MLWSKEGELRRETFSWDVPRRVDGKKEGKGIKKIREKKRSRQWRKRTSAPVFPPLAFPATSRPSPPNTVILLLQTGVDTAERKVWQKSFFYIPEAYKIPSFFKTPLSPLLLLRLWLWVCSRFACKKSSIALSESKSSWKTILEREGAKKWLVWSSACDQLSEDWTTVPQLAT